MQLAIYLDGSYAASNISRQTLNSHEYYQDESCTVSNNIKTGAIQLPLCQVGSYTASNISRQKVYRYESKLYSYQYIEMGVIQP